MTKEEAKSTVEAEPSARKLTKRIRRSANVPSYECRLSYD